MKVRAALCLQENGKKNDNYCNKGKYWGCDGNFIKAVQGRRGISEIGRSRSALS